MIWKEVGRVSGGLEIFSLDWEGAGDLEWIWKDLEGVLCIWKGFEGPLVNAGMANLLEEGSAMSLFRDYWLPCHRVNGM